MFGLQDARRRRRVACAAALVSSALSCGAQKSDVDDSAASVEDGPGDDPSPTSDVEEREQVPFRGIYILYGEASAFAPCFEPGERCMISHVEEVGLEMLAYLEQQPGTELCRYPGGGPCYVFAEGSAIIGEPGETGIVKPTRPGAFAREILVTDATTFRLVESVEEGCEQDGGP